MQTDSTNDSRLPPIITFLMSSPNRSYPNRSYRSAASARNALVSPQHESSTKKAKRISNVQKKFASLIPTVVIVVFAYVIGFLQGKVGRFDTPSSNWDDDNPEEISQPMNIADEDEMLSAVTTLRCLTTPGCFPKVPCASETQPQKIPVQNAWEEHSFCANDILSKSNGNESPCIVYSFGLNDSIDWEARMASMFGCEVFGFDPTSKHFNATPAPGVHFYKLGLQGVGADVSSTHALGYDAIDPTLLRELGEIVEMLGHQGRKIDVLKLDCEGCEYGVLNQLACGGDSHYVKQLMVEFHWQKKLGLMSDEDVAMGADAIQCLERERWGLVSLEESGSNPADAEYIDSVLRVIKAPYFILFATFRRIPTTQLLPWEVYRDVMDASWEKEKVYAKYVPKYGGEMHTNWPEEGLAEWNRTEKIYITKYSKHASLYRRPVSYDKFERFEKRL